MNLQNSHTGGSYPYDYEDTHFYNENNCGTNNTDTFNRDDKDYVPPAKVKRTEGNSPHDFRGPVYKSTLCDNSPEESLTSRYPSPGITVNQSSVEHTNAHNIHNQMEIISQCSSQNSSAYLEGNEAVNEDDICEFDPQKSKQTANEWLESFYKVAYFKGWNSVQKRDHMGLKLVGVAKQWHLKVNHRIQWHTMRMSFLGLFSTERDYFLSLHCMLNRIKPKNESMSAYFSDKIDLLNACEITGVKAVACIIGTLNNGNLIRVTTAQNFQDIDSLCNFLEKYENDNPKRKSGNTQSPNSNQVRLKMPKESKIHNNVPASQCPNLNKNTVEIKIKGVTLTGYVDINSECVTMKESSAYSLHLQCSKTLKFVRGFGGFVVKVIGDTEASVSIDGTCVCIPIFVVPDSVQAAPVVIGQEFIDRNIRIENGDNIKNCQQTINIPPAIPTMQQSRSFPRTTDKKKKRVFHYVKKRRLYKTIK